MRTKLSWILLFNHQKRQLLIIISGFSDQLAIPCHWRFGDNASSAWRRERGFQSDLTALLRHWGAAWDISAACAPCYLRWDFRIYLQRLYFRQSVCACSKCRRLSFHSFCFGAHQLTLLSIITWHSRHVPQRALCVSASKRFGSLRVSAACRPLVQFQQLHPPRVQGCVYAIITVFYYALLGFFNIN